MASGYRRVRVEIKHKSGEEEEEETVFGRMALRECRREQALRARLPMRPRVPTRMSSNSGNQVRYKFPSGWTNLLPIHDSQLTGMTF